METPYTVRVENLKATQRELRKLGNEDARQAIRKAGKTAAEKVVDAALPNVPVRTGRLKASVRSVASVTSAAGKAGGARVPYAPAVHWGTGPRAGQRGPHNIPRRAFLWDAQQRMLGEITEAYEDEIEDIVNQFRFEKGRDR